MAEKTTSEQAKELYEQIKTRHGTITFARAGGRCGISHD